MKMILPAVALLTAASLLCDIGAARAGQYDSLRQTAVAAVSGAGSAAGLARACGVDPQPIAAAAEQLFWGACSSTRPRRQPRSPAIAPTRHA